VSIGQNARDAGLPQQRLGKAQQHGIVASQQLTHDHTTTAPTGTSELELLSPKAASSSGSEHQLIGHE